MKFKFLFPLLIFSCILLVILVITLFGRQDKTKIVIYFQGKGMLLTSKSPHFSQIKSLSEKILISSNQKYQDLPSPKTAEEIIGKGLGIEVRYPSGKEIKIKKFGQKIQINYLLVSIQDNSIASVYYIPIGYQRIIKYSKGPFINTKEVKKIRKLSQLSTKIWQSNFSKYFRGPKYKLTLWVHDGGEGRVVDVHEVRSSEYDLIEALEAPPVASQKTDKGGKVVFNLPPGDYLCVVMPALAGSIYVELKKDTTSEIELGIMPPPAY